MGPRGPRSGGSASALRVTRRRGVESRSPRLAPGGAVGRVPSHSLTVRQIATYCFKRARTGGNAGSRGATSGTRAALSSGDPPAAPSLRLPGDRSRRVVPLATRDAEDHRRRHRAPGGRVREPRCTGHSRGAATRCCGRSSTPNRHDCSPRWGRGSQAKGTSPRRWSPASWRPPPGSSSTRQSTTSWRTSRAPSSATSRSTRRTASS